MSLRTRLETFIVDLTTIEASVVAHDQVLAYTRIEYEGDTINWLANHDGNDEFSIELQTVQLGASSECRAALLTLSTAVVKSFAS